MLVVKVGDVSNELFAEVIGPATVLSAQLAELTPTSSHLLLLCLCLSDFSIRRAVGCETFVYKRL